MSLLLFTDADVVRKVAFAAICLALADSTESGVRRKRMLASLQGRARLGEANEISRGNRTRRKQLSFKDRNGDYRLIKPVQIDRCT